MKGLEPSRPKAYAPKAYVYTNFTTSARIRLVQYSKKTAAREERLFYYFLLSSATRFERRRTRKRILASTEVKDTSDDQADHE